MSNKKIAFCFLIYDIINHEDIWNDFFKNVDSSKYNIYVHYKTQKELKFFEKYKLTNCIETQYGHITLVKAYNLLFKTALDNDEDNYKFCILSGSCIPFKNFDYIYNYLTKDNFGYFNIAPKQHCFPRCIPLIEKKNIHHINKSSGWFIVNKDMVKLFMNDNEIDTLYSKIDYPDEHYHITKLCENKFFNNIKFTLNLANDATTFTNWQGMDYKYSSLKDLKNYYIISNDEIDYLLSSKCLFGRKFLCECDLSYLRNKLLKKHM